MNRSMFINKIYCYYYECNECVQVADCSPNKKSLKIVRNFKHTKLVNRIHLPRMIIILNSSDDFTNTYFQKKKQHTNTMFHTWFTYHAPAFIAYLHTKVKLVKLQIVALVIKDAKDSEQTNITFFCYV